MKDYIIPTNIFIQPPIGTIDRKSVFNCSSSCGSDTETFECYGFVNEKYHITACVILKEDIHDKNLLFLRYVWIDNNHKKQGLGTLLVIFILRKLCKKIIIDYNSINTEEMQDILLTAVETNKIKAVKTKRLSRKELQNSFNKLDVSNSTISFEPSPSRYPLFAAEGLLAEALLIEKENTYG